MALDITYYRKLGEKVSDYTCGEEVDEYDGLVFLPPNGDFPRQIDGVSEGYYQHPGAENSGGFYAGAYSTYGYWREALAKMAGYEADGNGDYDEIGLNYDSGAFFELLHFSYCEGTIGPVVSKKLAKDFQDFQSTADAHPDEDFREMYANFRKTFEFASDGGAVVFH